MSESLESVLKGQIFGQDHVIKGILPFLEQKTLLGLPNKDRPVGMLFLGPPGVGKTELTILFTEAVFGSRDSLIRLDMTGFNTPDSVRSFVRSVQAADGREMTVLLDEIEKAHRDIKLLLYQILSDGRLSVDTGKVLDLTQTYVVMTSNLGSQGFALNHRRWSTLERFVYQEAETHFGTPIMSRIGRERIFVFRSLPFSVRKKLAEKFLRAELEHLRRHGYEIEIPKMDDLVTYFVHTGMDNRLGARPMQDLVEKQVREAIFGKFENGIVASGVLMLEASGIAMVRNPFSHPS